ncbi:MAG: DNA polymerase, partial [Eubacteriales bacterium]|nr:DNA polymerase [Eubacteriales bacterium]
MKTLSVDLETFSSYNLAECGVYKYVEAPDFEILLFGFSVNSGDVQVVDLACEEHLPAEIRAALTDPQVIKWAFNSQFERVCLSRWLGLPTGEYLAPQAWRCSMIWSAYMGLPLSLEGVGAVLGLDKQKLAEGKDLIRYFCKPCSPTAANGGRTRNLPSHDPERWATFKAYNQRDVETELAIQAKLARFPVPDSLWREYHQDQEINDRGVALDMTLVTQAIAADQRSRTELGWQMQALTELENPNSVLQMKQWLSDNGLDTESLGKKAVADLLKTAPEPLGQVLALRQQLAKSSVRKYQAMAHAVCQDGRARGTIQFYGANRTGRFSGRLIQTQNLPRNNLPNVEHARALLRSGNYEALELLYPSIPDVLSDLIRTAFVPRPGCRFIVADFAAIEARVIAWLAGEQWKLDVFAGDGKIYEATAARMFHVPIQSVTKGSMLRQKAKQAELACIAEGQLVLTDTGLVPIEKITNRHKLWDGENWISHGGLIDKGIGQEIMYEELTATPDHLVWAEGQSWPIQLGVAASS